MPARSVRLERQLIELVVARDHRDVDEVLQLPVDVHGLDRELVLGGDQDPVDVQLAAEPREVGHPTERVGEPAVAVGFVFVVDDPANQRHPCVLAHAEHDAVCRGARPHDEHSGGRQRVEEEAQEHAPDRDGGDGDDHGHDELGGVRLGRGEQHVQQRADGEGQHAALADAERELPYLEEGAWLQSAMGHPVDASGCERDHDGHREEGVDLEVGQQPSRGVHRHGRELRQEDQRQGKGDTGADEVTADLDERQFLVGDGAVRGRLPAGRRRGGRPLPDLDLRIRDAHRLPSAGALPPYIGGNSPGGSDWRLDISWSGRSRPRRGRRRRRAGSPRWSSGGGR